MPPVESLSADQARRVALAAQGFDRPRLASVERRRLRSLVRRLGVLQIDSVNVLARAHFVPPYSRLGAYPTELLEGLAYRHHDLFEYWGHEASLLPVESQPLFRWRMERAEQHSWGRMRRLAADRPDYIGWVREQVAERGPLGAGDLEARTERAGPWWDWHDAKIALEFLFWSGQVTTATRRSFERLYDLPERVLPAAVLAAPTPSLEDAQRELVRIAAGALGVATASDLADYFRLPVAEGRARVAELVEEGELVPVAVEGWRPPAFVRPDLKVPRWIRASALLSPFDPLIWERSRVERLFGFRYRIEIYVPAPKRQYGYYVLPFLLGDRLVARVDLKADRAAGLLRVQAAYAEECVDNGEIASALAAELPAMAGWLGLSGVVVAGRGDLAPALAALVGAAPPG